MATIESIVSYLDRELDVAAFQDNSHNGLQVANSGVCRRIAVGVDASLAFFKRAAERKADLMICHHGISWGDSLKRITGLNYRRVQYLMEHDLALYACHLPLDAHPTLGNNAQIVRALGLRGVKPFGMYHGRKIGYRGVLPQAMPYADFKQRAKGVFGNMVCTMDFGKRTVRTVAVVSGGAAAEIAEAGQEGIDVYVSGEANLMARNLAEEYGINALFAGHYATETFGVKAVAARLRKRFRLPVEFIDMGIKL